MTITKPSFSWRSANHLIQNCGCKSRLCTIVTDNHWVCTKFHIYASWKSVRHNIETLSCINVWFEISSGLILFYKQIWWQSHCLSLLILDFHSWVIFIKVPNLVTKICSLFFWTEENYRSLMVISFYQIKNIFNKLIVLSDRDLQFVIFALILEVHKTLTYDDFWSLIFFKQPRPYSSRKRIVCCRKVKAFALFQIN